MATQIYNSAAAEASAVVTTSPAHTLGITAINVSAGVRYLMVFDASSLPSNGSVPLWRVPLPATIGQTTVSFAELTGHTESDTDHYQFENGIVVALSSTAATLTVAVAADGLFDVIYHT